MSILVLGGDKIYPIRKILMELGIKDIIHWTARNQKNGRKKKKVIPIKVIPFYTTNLKEKVLLYK